MAPVPSFRDVAADVANGGLEAVKAALKEQPELAKTSEAYDEVMETVGDDDYDIAMAPVVGTLLGVAAKNSRHELVELLLGVGADANAPETVQWESGAALDKRLPLELAVWSGSAESVALLLKHGAKVDVVTAADGEKETPLEEATSRGLTEIVSALLGALKKTEETRLSAERMSQLLVRAIQAQSKETVELLLDHGADVNGGGSSGSQLVPLRTAARYRSPEIVSLLLSRGAEANEHTLSGVEDDDDATSLLQLAASAKGQLAEWADVPGLPDVERDWRRQLQAKHTELIKVLVASDTLKVEPGSLGHCLDLFRRFDLNANGEIEREELMKVLQHLDGDGSTSWTEERVDQLLKAADANRDGKIQLQEFLTYVFGESDSNSSASEVRKSMDKSAAKAKSEEKEEKKDEKKEEKKEEQKEEKKEEEKEAKSEEKEEEKAKSEEKEEEKAEKS
eukprot:TRINITY_DN2859_c0_g2_i1.p1 TRINITY_DN2859_c0_g2~~TRINITY_DN2859_c0_g2_i1.p1  ORF type:complete len:452 (+),score=179.53 TRINITY_DN2859_c0_g2_i1:133-1488(+)